MEFVDAPFGGGVEVVSTAVALCQRGFDTRIICCHVFSVIGSGHGAAEWGSQPGEWIDFYEHLEKVGPVHQTRIWYQPTYARRERMAGYAADATGRLSR